MSRTLVSEVNKLNNPNNLFKLGGLRCSVRVLPHLQEQGCLSHLASLTLRGILNLCQQNLQVVDHRQPSDWRGAAVRHDNGSFRRFFSEHVGFLIKANPLICGCSSRSLIGHVHGKHGTTATVIPVPSRNQLHSAQTRKKQGSANLSMLVCMTTLDDMTLSADRRLLSTESG